jgi:hypothetical protein
VYLTYLKLNFKAWRLAEEPGVLRSERGKAMSSRGMLVAFLIFSGFCALLSGGGSFAQTGPTSCKTDADCPKGVGCNIHADGLGICEPPPALPGAGEHGPFIQAIGCASDRDCPSGMLCAPLQPGESFNSQRYCAQGPPKQ